MKQEQVKASSVQVVPWHPVAGVVYLLAAFFGAQFLAGALISIYPGLRGWTTQQALNWLSNSYIAQFSYILLAESISIFAIYWFLRRHKVGFDIIGLRKPRLGNFKYTLLVLPFYYGLYFLTIFVISQLNTGINLNQEQQIGFAGAAGIFALSLTFISLVILPPITEEIMMRGFLYSSLRKALPLISAAIMTSFLFAIAHLQLGAGAAPLYIAAIDTFILSLFLIYLREKTGNLWAGIALHASKNFIAFLALFIFHLR